MPSQRETVTWGYCALNCQSRCPLKIHTANGRVTKVEPFRSDDGPRDEWQPRYCARGPHWREWANSPERLKWPLRRTGPRGSGQFERVSWDEAIDLAAGELKRVIEEYGNLAVYIAYGTGVWASTSKPFQRLLDTLGGKLGRYNNYSNAQIMFSAALMYGPDVTQGSSWATAHAAQTVFAFGASPAETRQGGMGAQAAWQRLLRESDARVYVFDCRLNDSVLASPDPDRVTWVPVLPGTDAALVAGIAHELVARGWADLDFLHRACVGFDEQTMPAAYAGRNLSYRAYLMGEGYDKVEKTPEWASKRTGVPADTIRELARVAAESDPLYVTQGWGPQRRSNGEWTSWAIMALPCLLGQVGRPGANIGIMERVKQVVPRGLPRLRSDDVSIPAFLYTDAIAHPESMTAASAGVRGAERLNVGVKYLIDYAGNCLTNQHGDINRAHDILADESACEFILCIDTLMTDSAKYADVLLPDLLRFEQVSQISTGMEDALYITTSTPAPTERFERKSAYEMARLMAARLGVEDAFAQGKSEEDWAREIYDGVREDMPELPDWEGAKARGVVFAPLPPHVALAEFAADPQACPLATPSGKIELFSEKLLTDTAGWEVAADDTIAGCVDAHGARTLPPVPAYLPEWADAVPGEGHPLYLTGFHYTGRLHSCFGDVDALKRLWPQVVWMNPLDAEARGIANGDVVRVSNAHGTTELPAFVTERVMPGVAAMAQGAWHDADMEGDRIDRGGNINTLTTHRPTPYAKANPQHSNACEICKAPQT